MTNAVPQIPEKLTQRHLVDQVAHQTGLTKKQSAVAVKAALEAIISALESDKAVGLPGVGTFSVKTTAPRVGFNPGTQERVSIPAGKKVAFKVATSLKDRLS